MKSVALQSASDFFGGKFRLQENFRSFIVNQDERSLTLSPDDRWCYIHRGRHQEERQFITINNDGASYHCQNHDCKLAAHTMENLFIEAEKLPPEIKDFFSATFNDAAEAPGLCQCSCDVVQKLQEEITAVKADNTALRTDVERLKEEIQIVLRTLSHYVVSERKEKYYQKVLEDFFGAGHMRIVEIGETDITTEDSHIEIKRWSKFSDVTGQLFRYQRAVKKDRLCVYYFGARPSGRKVKEIYELMRAAGIEMYSFAPDDSIVHHGENELEEEVDPAGNMIRKYVRDRLTRVQSRLGYNPRQQNPPWHQLPRKSEKGKEDHRRTSKFSKM